MSSELVSSFFLVSSFSFAYSLGRDHQRADLLGFPALIYLVSAYEASEK